MQGDFSRLRFETGQYDRVLMQQGRVQLDADWNAQAEIVSRRRQEQNVDLIGVCGAPAGSDGFNLEVYTALDFSGTFQAPMPAAPETFEFAERQPFTIAVALLPRQGGVVLSRRAEDGGGWSLAVNPDLTVTFARTELRHFREEVVDEKDYRLGRVEIIVLSEHKESEVRRVMRRVHTHAALAAGVLQWVTVRCDGRGIEVHLDGRLAARDPQGHRAERASGPLQIAPGFDGQISDLRFWSFALEHGVLASPRKFAHAAPHHLLAWFAFNESEGSVLHDRSGNGHDAPIEGAPVWIRELWIAAGRYYVDGVPCTMRAPARFTEQPDYPLAVLPAVPEGRQYYLGYLDSWDYFVTSTADPGIEEPALGGVDTTGRVRTVAQVRLLPLALEEGSPIENGDFAEWRRLCEELRPHGALAAQVLNRPVPLDNRLYRVEIQEPGGEGREPLFKWSRDNAFVLFPVTAVDAEGRLTLAKTPAEWELHPGDFVEAGDDYTVLSGAPATVAKIVDVDHIAETVRLDTAVSLHIDAHAFLRRWDEAGREMDPGKWLDIESGIQVRFSAGPYRAGDYWTLPVRTALQGVEWPVAGSDPVPLAPEGIAHRVCQLALVAMEPAGPSILRSYRRVFSPLTDVAAIEHEFVRKAGDEMSGSLRIDGRLHVQGAVGAAGSVEIAGEVRAGGELRAPRGARLGPTEVDFLRGTLADKIVGTRQIEDGSVTPEKLSFAIAGPAPGFLLLRPSRDTVPGYRYTGPNLVFRNPEMHWHPADEALSARTHAVLIGGHAYLLSEDGGHFWTFDPHSGHAHRRRPMPERRKRFALAVHDGRIYAIGGREDGRVSDRVTVYDPHDDSWTERRSLPLGRYDLAAAACRGEIYAVGGRRHRWFGTGWSHHTDAYDPVRDRWERRSPLPHGCARLALAEHHEHLYALGGERGFFGARLMVSDCYRYHPEADEWQKQPRLPLARRDAAAVSFHGKLVVAGGAVDVADPAVQEFDADTGVWSVAAPLPFARAGASAHVHGNLLLLTGGWGPACGRWPVLAVSAVYYGFMADLVGGEPK